VENEAILVLTGTGMDLPPTKKAGRRSDYQPAVALHIRGSCTPLIFRVQNPVPCAPVNGKNSMSPEYRDGLTPPNVSDPADPRASEPDEDNQSPICGAATCPLARLTPQKPVGANPRKPVISGARPDGPPSAFTGDRGGSAA
jgi:hypothetical protein